MAGRARRSAAVLVAVTLAAGAGLAISDPAALAAGTPAVVTTSGTLTFTVSPNPPVSGQAFTITGACAAGTASAQLVLTGEEHVLSPHLRNTTPNPDGTFQLTFPAGDWAPLPADYYLMGVRCFDAGDNVTGEGLLDEFVPHGASVQPVTLAPTPPVMGQDLTVSGTGCTADLVRVTVYTEGDWWLDGEVAAKNAIPDGGGSWQATFTAAELVDPVPSTPGGAPFVLAECLSNADGIQVLGLYEVARDRPTAPTTTTTTAPGSTTTTASTAAAAQPVRSNVTFTG